MSKFETFRDRLVAHYQEHLKDKPLFVVDAPSEDLWNLYLDSFPEGTNLIYKQRREYDCSCCRHFMKEMAPVVWIDENYHIHSIFEFYAGSATYQPVMDEMTSRTNEALDNEIEIVKYIFQYKEEQENAKIREKEKAEKKQRILELMAKKQDDELAEKSIEDLEAMLKEL